MDPIRTTFAVAALALGVVAGSTGLAARPELTGTGGGPETTIRAPNVRPSGQTVPTGAMASPTADPMTRTERQRALDRVLGGICEGC